MNTSQITIKPIEKFRRAVLKLIKKQKEAHKDVLSPQNNEFILEGATPDMKMKSSDLPTMNSLLDLGHKSNDRPNFSRRRTVKSKSFFDKFKSVFTRSSINKVSPEIDGSFDKTLDEGNHANVKATQRFSDTPRKGQTLNLFSIVNYIREMKAKRKIDNMMKETLTKQEIYKKFRQAYYKLRTIIRLRRIMEDIILYGTSSNLFDLTTRNRKTVKTFVYPNFDVVDDEYNDKNKFKWYIIHPNNKLKSIWITLILFMLLYNAIITPYVLAFIDDNTTFLVIDNVINILFCIDLVINFLCAYYNEENVLESRPKAIAKNYLKSWFFVDFISCIPYEEIGNLLCHDMITGKNITRNNLMRLSRIPRLYRLFKLTKIIKMIKVFKRDNYFIIDMNSDYLRLLSFGFQIGILIHVMGCLWYFLDKVDDFNPDTWVVRMGLLDNDNFTLYIASIYYIVTTLVTVGYGDITSYTFKERIFSIFWTVIGVGFYSFTIGILSSSFTSKWDRESSLKRKLTIMNEFAKEMRAPKSLKQKIKRILEYNSIRNCFSWADKKGIFDEIPINLRYEIIMNMQGKILADIPFFKEHGDKYFIVKVVQLLKPMVAKANEIIWLQGTSPDAIYFLLRGRVNYISYESLTYEDVKTGNKVPIIFKKMISGSYFGEIEIILRKKRSHTLQAGTDSEMFYIARQDFDNIISKEFPHIVAEMKEIALEREKRNWKALIDLRKFMEKAQQAKTPTKKTQSWAYPFQKTLSIGTTPTSFSKPFEHVKRSSQTLIQYNIDTNPIEEEKSSLGSSPARQHNQFDNINNNPLSSEFSSYTRSDSLPKTLSKSNTTQLPYSQQQQLPLSKRLKRKARTTIHKIPTNILKKNTILKRMAIYKRNTSLIAAGTVLTLGDDYERQPSLEKSYLRSILAGFKSGNNTPDKKFEKQSSLSPLKPLQSVVSQEIPKKEEKEPEQEEEAEEEEEEAKLKKSTKSSKGLPTNEDAENEENSDNELIKKKLDISYEDVGVNKPKPNPKEIIKAKKDNSSSLNMNMNMKFFKILEKRLTNLEASMHKTMDNMFCQY